MVGAPTVRPATDRYGGFEISAGSVSLTKAVKRYGFGRVHPDGGEEIRLLRRLRAGDEAAFVELIDRHHLGLVRLARSYVPSEAVAEEVAQETWLAVLRALPSFEGRSSLKTWLYRILVNRARTAGVKEHKEVPLDDPERSVDGRRFNTDGSWSHPPAHWVEDVEDRVRAETLAKSIRVAVDRLPLAQREVLTLRDVDGLTAAETCEILGLGQGHQRVLLHRARSSLRTALEGEFGEVAV